VTNIAPAPQHASQAAVVPRGRLMAKMKDEDLRELVKKRRDASVKHLSDNA
jgi:hypothetical protein